MGQVLQSRGHGGQQLEGTRQQRLPLHLLEHPVEVEVKRVERQVRGDEAGGERVDGVVGVHHVVLVQVLRKDGLGIKNRSSVYAIDLTKP